MTRSDAESRRVRAFATAAKVATIATGAIAGFHLFAALIAIGLRQRLHLARPAPNTMAALLAGSVALLLLLDTRRSRARTMVGRGLGVVVVAIGTITAVERATGVALLLDATYLGAGARFPLPFVSAALVLVGVALILFDVEKRGLRSVARVVPLLAGALAYVMFVARLYRLEWTPPALASHEPRVPMAAAFSIALLSSAILAARIDRGWASHLVRDGAAGSAVRRLVLPLVLVPTTLGALGVAAADEGWLSPFTAFAAVALFTILFESLSLGATARGLERADRARVAAEEAARRWKEMVEHAAFGVVVGGADMHSVSAANPAFAAMHGFRVEELANLPITNLFAKEALAEVPEALRRVHERGHYTWESVHVRKDGTTFPVVIDATAVRDAEGRVLYRIVYVQDITERKAVEAARARDALERERLVASLADERAWLRTVIERSPIGIIFIEGVDAPRVFANARAAELRGAPIGSTSDWWPQGAVFAHDGRVLQRSELPSFRALRGETVADLELVIRKPDGSDVPVLACGTPLRDARGTVRGALITIADLTAVKALERLREEWTSLVAHDLRQPLQVITLAMARLAAVHGGDRDDRMIIERVQRALSRLQRMVDDLLDLSRIEARQLKLTRRRASLGDVVREIAERPTTATEGHRIEVSIRGDDTEVVCDTDRIDQVLGNLLSNAAKYGKPGAPIRVEVEARESEVEVSVTNEGAGIDESERMHLFSRFFRTSSARTSRVRGVGLGLHICRGIVEAHGGRIWADSTPGVCTTFRFTLPREARASLISAPPS